MSGSAFRRAVVLGGLWGLAMTAMESFDAHVGDMTPGQFASFMGLVGGHYVLSSLVLSLGCVKLEPVLSPWQLFLALVGFALAEGLLHSLVLELAYAVGVASGLQALFVAPRSLLTEVLYDLWPMLFYGGLLVLALSLAARAERRQALLEQMQLEADQADAGADQSRAAALNAVIQPALLLGAVNGLQAAYDRDLSDARRRLNQFVDFLRAARTSERVQRSDLMTEADLLVKYARLRDWLGHGDLSVSVVGALADAAFPGAILMVAVNRLLAHGPVRVEIGGEACLGLSHADLPPAIAADIEAGLRQALDLHGGTGASVSSHDNRLRIRAAAPTLPIPVSSFPILKGAGHVR